MSTNCIALRRAPGRRDYALDCTVCLVDEGGVQAKLEFVLGYNGDSRQEELAERIREELGLERPWFLTEEFDGEFSFFDRNATVQEMVQHRLSLAQGLVLFVVDEVDDSLNGVLEFVGVLADPCVRERGEWMEFCGECMCLVEADQKRCLRCGGHVRCARLGCDEWVAVGGEYCGGCSA